MLKAALLGFTAAFAQAKFADCDPVNDVNDGPFAPANFFDITWDDTIFYGVTPTPTEDQKNFPLMAFMHGTTGCWSMYEPILNHYASHGFLVVFPHIKGPTKDRLPLTTNTDGEYLLKAIEFAKAANADETSALYDKVDVDNIIIAGHSMGATCSIMASKRFNGTAKLTVTQHPGICGPFGPPPKPATWDKEDLLEVTKKNPVLFMTATNDGAFWPSPLTAKHELGCFNGSIDEESTAIFTEFNRESCAEDKQRKP